jgi:hypothetical protein
MSCCCPHENARRNIGADAAKTNPEKAGRHVASGCDARAVIGIAGWKSKMGAAVQQGQGQSASWRPSAARRAITISRDVTFKTGGAVFRCVSSSQCQSVRALELDFLGSAYLQSS